MVFGAFGRGRNRDREGWERKGSVFFCGIRAWVESKIPLMFLAARGEGPQGILPMEISQIRKEEGK